MEPIDFEGLGYIPLQKPQLGTKTSERNRGIKAVGTIILYPAYGNIGGIIHLIGPDTTGFIIDYIDDFSFSRIDAAFLKEHICEPDVNDVVCENDEIFVLFQMHVIAKIPIKAVEILKGSVYATT